MMLGISALGMKCNRIQIGLCSWRLVTMMLRSEQDAAQMKMSLQQRGSPRALPWTQGDKNNRARFRIEPASFAKGLYNVVASNNRGLV